MNRKAPFTLTVQNMYIGVGGLRVAGHARVVARVIPARTRNVQDARLALQIGRDVHAPVRIVVDHPVVVVPEDVRGPLGTLQDHARELQDAAQLEVLLARAGDLGARLCEEEKIKKTLINIGK
jgi:hypothetical protein